MRHLQDFFSSSLMSLTQSKMRDQGKDAWKGGFELCCSSRVLHWRWLSSARVSSSCTMSGSSTASGKLTGALHHLKGTLWCRTVQRSQFPVQKHLCHFPHQHRYNVKTNTAWHQFSQISPKYSTLLLHTRYTKKSYSLWGLTLCVYHVPEQPGSVPLAPTSTPPCHPLQGANRAVELK